MKNTLFAVLKFALFLVVFAAGSFFPPFHIERVLAVTPAGTRIFVMDGLLLALALCVLLLVIESARKRIRTSGPWTAAAFVLAVVAGLVMKFGLLTR